MKIKPTMFLLPALIAAALVGCNSGDSGGSSTTSGTTTGGTASNGTANKDLPLIALSQTNSKDPWRQVFDAETKAAADKDSSDFQFEEQQANGDPNTQISQINTLVLKSPKVLLVSPSTEALEGAVAKAYDAKIPVILLDRSVPGDKYTCLVAGDNHDIGKQAGEFIAKKLNGKGTVLMIRGIADATPTHDRQDGAMESFKKYPGITVIIGDDCKYEREAAQNYMESFLQSGKPFDAVYAHNDEMAIGAYQAWKRAAKPGPRPIFVGIDGCQKETVQDILDGKLDATFQYPIPGPKGIEIADDILKGKQPTDKKILLPTVMVTKDNAAQYMKDNPSLAP